MLPSKLDRAIRFALEAHEGKYRKGEVPLPYVVHPMDVLFKVRHLGGISDEDALAAAALHDVIEDAHVSAELLEDQFGPKVARLVQQLTRRFDKRADRYSAMLLQDIAAMDAEAQVIKLCDRLANLWEMERTLSVELTCAYADEALKMLAIVPRDRAPEAWDQLRTLAEKCVAKDENGVTVTEMDVIAPPDK
ncbi:MAG TPA: HD domain-containing protein [Fimbriimonas sp.]|nr:HD domain-containing protein [Fimbriimonas sp.]